MISQNRPAPRILRTQTGFTLIEIIAVLVILGILAVVALPKFADMQTEARIKTMEGIAASAMSQLSMDYSQMILKGTDLTTAQGADTCAKVSISDTTYTLTCAGTLEGDVTIKVVKSGTTDVDRTWHSPSKA